ncbi:DUF2017 domain-containing protein [Nocardioides jishulii]|uniref:DUF2017 domain-containing protein n=1 Tax=Nocardioides jishulii TaxID=2575440 RepID=A0A4U2YJJ2_9ACTN|nr:DUF2017 domain-containing protein [Nocardioides jishulii]QCX26853.1 DUF2017 family protein [Nocardioides jishulii]TKI61336.1 DUF2017 domain-containing protein [Nocardioides jishulii]
MGAFTRHRRSGQVIANFSGFEADLLRNLASQLVELLRDEQPTPDDDADPLEAMFDFSGPVDEPEDPVLLRLFPTAYADDPEAAGEFRRYTETTLREAKERTAMTMISSLEEGGLPPELEDFDLVIDVELDAEEALAWLRGLTDLRLALAARLGVEDGDEEFWEALDDEDPRAATHDIYEWLGYLQETLVMAVDV